MPISDMYSQVRQQGVPIEEWVDWIKGQLKVNDAALLQEDIRWGPADLPVNGHSPMGANDVADVSAVNEYLKPKNGHSGKRVGLRIALKARDVRCVDVHIQVQKDLVQYVQHEGFDKRQAADTESQVGLFV